MPISLSPIETTYGRAALVKEWRAVHYEIAQPGKQTLVTPDGQEIEIKGVDHADATSIADEATANANSVDTTGEGAGNGAPQASASGV